MIYFLSTFAVQMTDEKSKSILHICIDVFDVLTKRI